MPPKELELTDPGSSDSDNDKTMVSSFSSSSSPSSPLLSQEIWLQFQTAYPTLIGMCVSKIPWLLSLRFVGGIGATELAAAALATTLCNVTGLSLSVGLSSALTTLTGQARGELQARREREEQNNNKDDKDASEVSLTEHLSDFEDDEEETDLEMEGLLNIVASSSNPPSNNTKKNNTKSRINKEEPLMPLVFLYRGTVIQLACVLPVGCWWLYGIQSTLVTLGQGEELSALTQDYLRILAPQLWAYSVSWTLTAWLQAMEMAFVPAYAAVAVLITHVPLNLFYIHVMQWGYLGCAAATVTTQILQLIYIAVYVFGTERGRRRLFQNMYGTSEILGGTTALTFWKEFHMALEWKGIAQYLALALPGVVIISEWWASEIAIFLSGRLAPTPDLALGGMTLYQSINSFCYMFPVAFSIAGSTRVSNLLGAGLDQHAAFASNVSITCAAVVSGVIGCTLYWTPHTFFPSLFAPGEQDLVDQAARTIPLLSFYVFADGFDAALNGTIKGCGRQVITMPIVIVSYWFIGLPTAYYLAFVRNEGEMCEDDFFCGDVGLVTGMTLGTVVHAVLLAVTVLGFTDWQLEAQKAYERIRGGDTTTLSSTRKVGEDTVEMMPLSQQETMSVSSDSSTDAYE